MNNIIHIFKAEEKEARTYQSQGVCSIFNDVQLVVPANI